MSGFFGIFRPQGGSVDLDSFEQMRKATEREGFDGLETHVEEKIAMGHLMLRVSPEAKYDQQPLHSECGRYLLVGHFRLDYRDELGDKLGLIQSELELTPDSVLVMLAYQKWKEQCVHHIEGDWAFALFDSSSNSLMLAKDRTGYSALFYTQYKDAIYFSCDVNVIGAIEAIPFEVDLVQFYRLSLPSFLVEKGKTLLKDVFHLTGGTYILCEGDTQIGTFQYWKKENSISIRYHDDQDYAEHMQSIFAKAVKSRIRTEEETGIFLSSGLDSMAVAYFSAAELMSENKTLYSYTSYPYYLSEIDEKYNKVVNEVPLVQLFVEQTPNVEPTYLNFPDVNMRDYFDSDLTKDLYHPIISTNTFWIQGIYVSAKSKKIKRILNGQMGNMTISFNAPFIQVDNIFSFRFNLLFADFKRFKKKENLSNFETLKRYYFNPLRRVIKSYFKQKIQFERKYLSKSKLFDDAVLEKIEKQIKLNSQSFIPDFYFFKSSRQLQIDQLETYLDFSGMKWFKGCHLFGMEGLDPSSDSKLVDFILSIPVNQFNKDTKYKLIYRNMMLGKLDQEILYNPFSMRQSFDFWHRFSKDLSFSSIFSSNQVEDAKQFNQEVNKLHDLYSEVVSSSDPYLKTREIMLLLRNLSLINCILNNKRFKFDNYLNSEKID